MWYCLSFFHPSLKGPRAFYQGNCSLWKWKQSESGESTGCWVWPDIQSMKPNTSLGLLVVVGHYGTQVNNEVLSQVQLTVGPQTHRVVISPGLQGKIRREMLWSWQNLHIHSLSCGDLIIIMGKAKWKPLKLPLAQKIVIKKQYCTNSQHA
jgi:hypothetical protein